MAWWRGDLALARGLSLHGVLWWTVATIIAALLAALAWAIVTPVSPLGPWQPASVHVMPAPARAALFAGLDPFNRTPPVAAPAEGAGTVTSLSLVLFATRSTPGGTGSAIIAGADGQQQVYRVGTEVMPGVVLSAVTFDHVELTRNGAKELLYLDQSDAAPSADGVVSDNPVTTPALADGEDPPLTVDSARRGIGFGPHAEGGRIAGLEVLPQGDGKAFRAAGFQPGDIVTSVNGKPVNGPGDASLVAGALRPGGSLSVVVKRGNQQLPLAINLAP